MLSDAQTERYSRQIILPEIGGRGQQRLLSTTIALVVAEPATSYALQYLAAAGIGRISVATNATADWIDDVADLNPDCRIEAQPLPASYDDWIAGLAPASVILDHSSEAQSAAINSACVRTGTPLIWGRAAGATAWLALFHPMVAPGCLACADVRSRALPAEPGVLRSIAASMLGSLQCAEALKLVLDPSSALAGRALMIDAASSAIDSLPLECKRTCPECAGRSYG